MTDLIEDIKKGVKRSIGLEFQRMEEDFDQTRDHRKVITEKLMSAVSTIKLVDEKDGQTQEDVTDAGLRVITTALKALADTEKANAAAISLKLRQNEQETANATALKDRITVVLEATKPGRISNSSVSPDDLAAKLSDMFEGEIQDFELKTNPNSLNESDIS